MGDVMRQYWVPALLSSELPEPDGDPVRVLLLGERLIAFRNSAGEVGLVQNSCPHRGASLFFGQVQDGCLRCIYHGWQFDTSGRVVEMPNEPAESDFKDRLPAFGYRCVEAGGVVWTYMGPRDTPPPMPHLEPLDYEVEKMVVRPSMFDCNWLQALEGDMDTVHASFLHTGHGVSGDAPEDSFLEYAIRDRPIKYKVIDTAGGVLSGAYRPAGDNGDTYWRIASFAFPFYTYFPTGVLGAVKRVAASVPMDDTHVMRFVFTVSDERDRLDPNQRIGLHPDTTPAIPNTTDWYGRWRRTKHLGNDFEIDRQLQKSGDSYTGITGFNMEDKAMVEGMGPIPDRSGEHLGSTDAMIVRVRRRLLDAARALREDGTIPPGVDDPEVYFQRSGGIVLPTDVDWLEGTEDRRQAGIERPELDPLQAAGI
jgi:phenylpropionate dioxygenase-like ring-hydroxylating dioxygenase large terminal subunit